MTRNAIKTVVAAARSVAAVAIVVFLYYRHDPSSPVAPKCLFRLLTGYDCPGCGSQRAFHALLHGRLAEAWGYNPYLFFAVPAGAVLIAAEAVRRSHPRLHRTLVNPLSATIILAATIAWWVFRNL